AMIAKGLFEEIVIAGFGGQGVILIGKLLSQAAMQAGYQITYMPSYGPEVRGGTANCMVVIATEPIASPVVANPSTVIAMNKASLDRFSPKMQSGGLLVMNRSMIETDPARGDIEFLAVPADDLALELGSPKSANMVALGAYLARRELLDVERVADSLPQVLAARYHNTLGPNRQALLAGAEFALSAV
ncbi:MAG: 2-oxoacid:acceptor oxidoreductase family protein, partial [Sedimentisphaerales bacterium]|nr:2-oxoacid:acceptor oxidoreductase family protein [Sedimentisphaerales bacterium]